MHRTRRATGRVPMVGVCVVGNRHVRDVRNGENLRYRWPSSLALKSELNFGATCDKHFCADCEEGGGDDTPQEEWICNACLEVQESKYL